MTLEKGTGAMASNTPSKFGDLLKRVSSALVAVTVALFCLDQGYPFIDMLCAVFMGGGFYELLKLTNFHKKIEGMLLATLSLIGFINALYFDHLTHIPLISSLILFGVLSYRMLSFYDGKSVLTLSLGLLYISGAFYLVHHLLSLYPVTLFMWFLALIWISDTGAYLSGRLIGGPKFAPKLSPNKTWSGYIGGTVMPFVCGIALFDYLDLSVTFFNGHLWVATLCIILASHAGDLLESLVKRLFNVKDTSSLFPGHGGILDRLDSLLLAIYALFLFLK